jgi:OmpA-OmpF porin, OOP family
MSGTEDDSKMKLRSMLLGMTVLAVPVAMAAPAMAQPLTGPYVSLGAGANWLLGQAYKNSPGMGTPAVDGTYHTGAVGDVAAGYGLGNGFRVELEGDYRYNGLSSLKNGGSGVPTSSNGYQQQYSAMVNVLFDMDIGSRYVFPYIGAGIGYGWDQFRGIGVNTPNERLSLRANGTAGNFAYQGILGASFPVPNVPGLSGTLEYRVYGEIGPMGYTGTATGFVAPGVASSGNFDVRGANINNAALVGLRYAFNVAPPPPPPAPPPAPVPAAVSRNYLVFFDWDRADLSDRARQIIAEAAENSKKVSVTRIQVNGYTDTSGTPAYNQKLSLRRADAVAAELVKDGVARTEIGIEGFGETHLLVPTGPGVREPQNRRVEIILQ